MSKTYEDELYCDHCEEDTIQEVFDSEHERDSSNDWRICKKCRWRYSGWSGKWSPPSEEDED